ncbi:ABC-type polar amino acid transport system ATPase subunit [Streptomyces sp. V4I2]|nr:ABC-type polar amino acid transport system ATPase subunit [Streptomyces sp. V4I2]
MTVMVDIRSVHKSFGSLDVLKGIDLAVRAGEVTVILGYRRSGDRLYELREREVPRQRTRIGFVFQNFNLFPHLTVLDNIIEAPVSALKRPRKDAVETARRLLDRVGLAEKADAYPRHLSGGQQLGVPPGRSGTGGGWPIRAPR